VQVERASPHRPGEPAIPDAPTEAELAALYARYAGPIHHRALSILKNEELAQEAVQETFVRVMRNWDQFRGDASPYTWMYRITTNFCLNQLRNRNSRLQKQVNHRTDIMGEETTWMRDESEADVIRALLADADLETRQVVMHLYFDDMTKEQTALAVGLSVPTVRKRLDAFLRRAKRNLSSPSAAAALALATFFVSSALFGA
jgi:RNA polymerase sigma-70 factor, ECF subfamily